MSDRPEAPSGPVPRRNILLITSDQQRYDALGCNGGTVARTPVLDSLAASGVRFERAYAQNTVCMPARSTILTGQYPSTHGVVANGIPLPEDAPSVAALLSDAGYRTALIGKAHFEPIGDPELHYRENQLAARGEHGPYRGFDHVTFAGHGPLGTSHYSSWLKANHPEHVRSFARIFDARPSGETGGPEIRYNAVPRELYHTDWLARATCEWLAALDDGPAPWFCWMSFPDPHHPWDPPASERHRVRWQDLDLPAGYPGSPERIRAVLEAKPAHWLAWYEGRVPNIDGAPANFVPATLTADQLREIAALIHIENELIDEACGQVLTEVERRGWRDTTDVLYLTDHGELQGDFGLLYKGPYHVDATMRLPLIWQPAPVANVKAAAVSEPVGQVDLAPTLCAIAGVDQPIWMQGRPLPTAPGSDRERVLCEWDSQFTSGHSMRSIYRDGWLCTAYPRTAPLPGALDPSAVYGPYKMATPAPVVYDGTEGELYDLSEDPHQFTNRWDDPAVRSLRDDLLDDLRASQPAPRERPLAVETVA